MKRTTRNNIIRYIVAAVFVTAVLLVTFLVCIALDWITDISGWPIFQVAAIADFIYVVWLVGKNITIKKEKE